MNLFKLTSIAASFVFAFLTFQLLFQTESFVTDLGLQANLATSVLCKRAAMFTLGYSLLAFLFKNIPASPARQYFCLSQSVMMLGFAFLGTFEYLKGNVNASIWVAIPIESILATSFGILFLRKQEH